MAIEAVAITNWRLFKPPAAARPTLRSVAGESGRAAGYAGAHAARTPLVGAPLPPHPRMLPPLCAHWRATE